MAQDKASSPEAIYDALVADDTFMSFVGQRIFEAGSTVLDAISIVTPGAELPKTKKITGLEVVIHDVSNLGRRNYITGDLDITTTWKVYLLAWPPANGATMNDAARRIMERFSKATTIETVPTPDGLGSTIQLLVLIPSDSVIVPLPLEV